MVYATCQNVAALYLVAAVRYEPVLCLNQVSMITGVESDHGIMSGKAVFNYKGCDRGLGVPGEQHVVADTESNDDIEIGFQGVKELCLEEGITGGFELFGVADFIIRGDAQLGLVNSAAAADC